MAQSMTDRESRAGQAGRKRAQGTAIPSSAGTGSVATGRGELEETVKIILVQPRLSLRPEPTCRGLTGPQLTSRSVPGAKFTGVEEASPEVRDASGEGVCHASGERGATQKYGETREEGKRMEGKGERRGEERGEMGQKSIK